MTAKEFIEKKEYEVQEVHELWCTEYLESVMSEYAKHENKDNIIDLMSTAYLAGHQDTVDGNASWCKQGSKEVCEEILIEQGFLGNDATRKSN